MKPGRNMEIAWVKILHNGQFEVDERDEDEESSTYGDVKLYRTKDFTTTTDLNFSKHIAPGVKIHSSRCVHFKESNGLSYGTSRIQKCYNQLIDITKLSGASAEVYWLGAFSGLSIETEAGSTLTDEQIARIKDGTTKYFEGLARALVFEGATSKLLYPAIVSPKDHFDLQITMISIATGIPRRFLTGAEAAKLASQQDTLNWMERVTNRREMFCGPKVVAPVVQRCIDAGVIPQPKDGNFTVAWPRTQSLALNERSDSARNMTAAWEAYGTSGLSDVVPFEAYLLYACGFSETEATDIASKTDVSKWKKMLQEVRKAANTVGSNGTPVKKSTVADPDPAKKSATLIEKLETRVAELEDGKVSDIAEAASAAAGNLLAELAKTGKKTERKVKP